MTPGLLESAASFGGLLTSQLGMAGFSRVFTSAYDAAGRRDSLAIQDYQDYGDSALNWDYGDSALN